MPPHGDCPPEEARPVTFKKPSSNTLLGINVIGGNASGIFISDIEKDSLAALQGSLRVGDRILQVSHIRFSCILANSRIFLLLSRASLSPFNTVGNELYPNNF